MNIVFRKCANIFGVPRTLAGAIELIDRGKAYAVGQRDEWQAAFDAKETAVSENLRAYTTTLVRFNLRHGAYLQVFIDGGHGGASKPPRHGWTSNGTSVIHCYLG